MARQDGPPQRWLSGFGTLDWRSDERAYASLLDALTRDLLEVEAVEREMQATAHRSLADVQQAQLKLDQLRDPGRAKAWLFSILRNAYLHRVRAEKHAPCVSLEDMGDVPEPLPEPLPPIEVYQVGGLHFVEPGGGKAHILEEFDEDAAKPEHHRRPHLRIAADAEYAFRPARDLLGDEHAIEQFALGEATPCA